MYLVSTSLGGVQRGALLEMLLVAGVSCWCSFGLGAFVLDFLGDTFVNGVHKSEDVEVEDLLYCFVLFCFFNILTKYHNEVVSYSIGQHPYDLCLLIWHPEPTLNPIGLLSLNSILIAIWCSFDKLAT